MHDRLIALLFILTGCTFDVPLPCQPLPFDGDVAAEDSVRSSSDAELVDSISPSLEDLGPVTDGWQSQDAIQAAGYRAWRFAMASMMTATVRPMRGC